MLAKLNNVHLGFILLVLLGLIGLVKWFDSALPVDMAYKNKYVVVDPGLSRVASDTDTQRLTRIVEGSVANWTRLKFEYPSDASYEMYRDGDNWKIGDRTIDPEKIQKYLSGLANSQGTVFLDGIDKASLPKPVYTVTIEREGKSEVVVWCFVKEDVFILRSSMNRANFFDAQAGGLFDTVYAGVPRFFGSEE